MHIISIVGRSNSGKTTLIVKLIPALVALGYKVATVKHDAHNFEVDKVGKDSWRHKNAGAEMTVVTSEKKVALFTDADKDNSLESVCEKFITGVDVVLTEGYKMSKYPKIEVSRFPNCKLLCGKDDNLIAVVGDCDSGLNIPAFELNDIKGIVELIKQTIAKESA